ncbi:DVU0298 family protein [Maridesulfovibrio bastinii]|uniref:DVU0298 family protein n=1 Tax=Maridesulfovibrio bastinii TaxID=47157 RepID=UPI00041FBB67|nr:DVU0298 family protein [Maridesulfovibrio bastinii]
MPSGRQIKKEVLAALAETNWDKKIYKLLEVHPAQSLIAPLFSSLCDISEEVRWHGISAFGIVVGRLADEEIDRARVVMRRITWMLNEESGGCGWGVPEAMGEICASSEAMASEYGRLVLSYIHEEESKPENFLEFTMLLKGAVWGVCRLAQSRPDIAAPAFDDLVTALKSHDPATVGIACWGLGLLGNTEAAVHLRKLKDRDEDVVIYRDRSLVKTTVGQLAGEALGKISGDQL